MRGFHTSNRHHSPPDSSRARTHNAWRQVEKACCQWATLSREGSRPLRDSKATCSSLTTAAWSSTVKVGGSAMPHEAA